MLWVPASTTSSTTHRQATPSSTRPTACWSGANPTTGQPSPTGFSRGDPLPTTVVRGSGYFTNDPPPTLVDVPAHGAAIFRLHWEQVPVGNETTCPMASRLAVTPPDEYVALTIPIQIRACGGGHLDVSAVFSL